MYPRPYRPRASRFTRPRPISHRSASETALEARAPNAETVVVKGIDQLGDSRRPLLCQVQGEHVAEFDSSEAESIHRRTVTRPSDIDGDCRYEAGKLNAAAPRGAWAGESLRTGPCRRD